MLTTNGLQVYYGESQILKDITIKIPRGEAVCVMGRNGVGKTTLIKTLVGTLQPRGGSINYEGQDITREPAHKRSRAGISYVPQGRGIFPHMSVYENLLIGFESVKRPSQKHIQDTVDGIYEIFPVLKEMRRRVAGTLSGGQQQQLAIGRALVSNPQMVMLDEPTEGIQPSIVEEIQRVIVRLRTDRGISVLLIEQFLDFAMGIADYCYVMSGGTIVSEGAASELSEAVIREHLSV
ncbi:MAG: urea ABC transporter ATP-binding subunit UrtE [Anaerolineae bacterium]|nr:urea ABC transporter ATP-binding subunit UrtE [Anaerolineae bacterium]